MWIILIENKSWPIDPRVPAEGTGMENLGYIVGSQGGNNIYPAHNDNCENSSVDWRWERKMGQKLA